MKLWEKGNELDQRVEDFTVGDDPTLDLRLATYDILGSLAHAHMLEKVGLLTTHEVNLLARELKSLNAKAIKGQYAIEEGMEDIHSQLELDLIHALGDLGKKIHTARSRNDQVLLDLRLYLRDEVQYIVLKTESLVKTLLQLSTKHHDVLIPGYTHLQAAMPSSFGLWFGAYAESLIDDLTQWRAAFDIINQNPLGSAAGYGSSLPIDREHTTKLLGFKDLNYNVVHAQLGRGKTEQSISFAIAGQAMTMSKLAMDVCLYNSQNFGFLKLDESFTTGSSIMPHKKNPDVFELIRGHCNRLQQLPGDVSGLAGALPSGYHRDYQLLKGLLFAALDNFKMSLDILHAAIQSIEVNGDAIKNDNYAMIFSVERVNELVLAGTPFRDAYLQVAEEIKAGKVGKPEKLNHTHLGSIGNLATERIESKLNAVRSEFDFGYKDSMARLVQ